VDGFWATKSEDVGLIVRALNFEDFQPMLSWSTKVTDRQTDRRHAILNTALCSLQGAAKKSNPLLYFANF